MLRFNTIKVMCLILLSLSAPLSFANQAKTASNSIYATSIDWNDEFNRSKLLATAPAWSEESINTMFTAYLHPYRYQLITFKDAWKYNVEYMNAFWGPVNNPFNKIKRPAKVFVFVKYRSETFYMAPLIKNVADANFYVFDNAELKPMLLTDWIKKIKKNTGTTSIFINVCNGYGNLPTETCEGQSYQNETGDISPKMLMTKKNMTSAHRDIHEDWTNYTKKSVLLKKSNSNAIYNESVAWDDLSLRAKLLNTVATWPNYNAIKNNFEKIRNLRYFTDSSNATFLRRISWLYPDDGCWTRATAAIKDLFGPFNNPDSDFNRPSKVFAFGNLCVNTSNHPDGNVTWWYHTAPIIRDAETNQTYVLDPAVQPKEPLTIEKWMNEISSRTGACGESKSKIELFNICDGYGATPSDACKDPKNINFATEIDNALMQISYQREERSRQVELGRDADKVLGDSPPWD